VPRRLLLVLAAVLAAGLAAAGPVLVPAGRSDPGPAARPAATPAPGPPGGPAGPPAREPAYPDALFAPLDRPGPAFSAPPAALAASLTCAVPPNPAVPPNLAPAGRPGAVVRPGGVVQPGGVAVVRPGGIGRSTVLLLADTGVGTAASFGWNYQPALTATGIPWCASDAPGANNGDIQTRAEYVAYALREVRNRTGRRVAVVGHGQGALAARMALRFWPDLRDDVSDLVALAPPNQGTAAFDASCARACPPAYWQQRPGSMLISAVNSRQAGFPGVDYTIITSAMDEVVTPQPVASTLPFSPGPPSAPAGPPAPVSAVAVQDVCPGYVADHLGVGGYDAVAWALALDALTHPGPAVPARLNRAVCGAKFMPSIDGERFLDDAARAAAVLDAMPPPSVPTVGVEPAPRCWVLAQGCLRRGTGSA
jgi:hypothetical protein